MKKLSDSSATRYSKQLPRLPHLSYPQTIQFASIIEPRIKGPGMKLNNRIIVSWMPSAKALWLSATHLWKDGEMFKAMLAQG